MKPILLSLLCVAGLYAQASATVTSPANGAVVTWGVPLTATISGTSSADHCIFFIDNRREGFANNLPSKTSCSLPKMQNVTYADERAATIYVEVYDVRNTLLATSATNTFRINNGGINAAPVFNFGGVVTRGATISGIGTVTSAVNTSGTPTPTGNWDGDTSIPPNMWFVNSSLNTTTGAFAIPIFWQHTGAKVNAGCQVLIGQGGSCAGGNGDMPSAFSFGPEYYLSVLSAGQACLSTTLGNAQAHTCITGGTQGVTTEYTVLTPVSGGQVNPAGNYGQIGNPATYDTTYFPDARHRHSSHIQTNPGPYNASFNFLWSNITTATGIVNATNFPLMNGQLVTLTGTIPAQWSSTMYSVTVDANDFGLSLTQGGAIVTSLSCSTCTTITASFTDNNPFWSNDGGTNPHVLGSEINWFTTSNGAVPQTLRTKYARITGISGDTFTLGGYILNCDGSTTSISPQTNLIWTTSDSTRATVSTSGVVTLGSTAGHATISVIDNVHYRDTRVDVEVRNDRTTFKQFSKGYGILNSYDPSKSVVGITPFNAIYDLVTHNPFPTKYIKGAGITAMIGGFVSQPLALTYANLAAWQTQWNDVNPNDAYSKAYALQAFNAGYGLLFYGDNAAVCAGYPAYLFLINTWGQQQAMATMLNDMAPNTLGHEHCDEMTTPWGNAMKPRGDMGSGDDSLGNATVGGMGTGMTSIVTSGGVTTVNLYTISGWINSGSLIQISGAASSNCVNLNGPHTVSNLVYSSNISPIGSYITSFQISAVGVPNATCNHSTDPALVFALTTQGVGSYVSTINLAMGWGSALTSINGCSSNTCTVNWTGVGSILTAGQTVKLTSFTSSGLNGYWRADNLSTNSFTITFSSVGSGPFNSSSDPGATIDGVANFPQAWSTNMFPGGSYVTGASAPMSGSLLGGGSYPQFFASWYGPSSSTQYIAHNITIGQSDRYGSGAMGYRDFFRGKQTTPFVDGSLPINMWAVDKPIMYGTPLVGDTCDKYISTLDCQDDKLPGDQIELAKRPSQGNTFSGNIVPWIMPNAAGAKQYQLISGLGTQWAPPSGCRAAGCAAYQAAPNWIDVHQDQYLGMANAHLAIVHEDKYLLQPPLSSPDVNTGPGPYPNIECSSHQAAIGNAMLCANLTEEQQTVTIDTSIMHLGGPMRKWLLTGFGDTVTSISSGTMSDTITLLEEQAVLYISQASGATSDLVTQTVALSPGSVTGGTNSVVRVKYFPTLQQSMGTWQAFDAGSASTVSVPVNLHNLDVYYDICYTDSSYVTKYCGPEQVWKAQ